MSRRPEWSRCSGRHSVTTRLPSGHFGDINVTLCHRHVDVAVMSLFRMETRVSIERLLDRTERIAISEAHHGPPDDRRYAYMPTYILRGLMQLHLDITPAPRPASS